LRKKGAVAVGSKRGKKRLDEPQIGLREQGRGLQTGWGTQGAKKKEGRGSRQKGPMLRVLAFRRIKTGFLGLDS